MCFQKTASTRVFSEKNRLRSVSYNILTKEKGENIPSKRL
jgi:hypothetical protein